MYHTHGLFVANHCALLGASTMLYVRKFDADAVIERLMRATVFMGVPTYYTRLLANPAFSRDTCRNIRVFISGSAPLLAQTFLEFQARTGHEILERYGMTETSMNTSNPYRGPRLPETVGLPLPGVSARIVSDGDNDLPVDEVGQLLIKGPNVFKGYWRHPKKTAEDFTADGYFRTGDLARRDKNGYISIVGRAKDLIITGGLNVYPKEIESYLDALEGVQESAVLGVPHQDFGEAVVAIVVRKNGYEHLTDIAILDQLRGHIANYKVPKQVIFAAELPRNTMGKVQKNVLRQNCVALV
jgi:malonyl-CoA/methylmalonyl-CoA synthetase